MARDRANISTNIWTDQDWRNLPRAEQHLYLLLMSHPTLSYAGVADWRETRLAAMTADSTPESVRAAAESLQAQRFVFIDDETEEILVRSFLRHDGLLKQPKLSISMVNAYAAIASSRIREVVTFELQKLYREFPEWAAFGQEKVLALVKGKGTDMADFTQGFTHSFTPDVTQGFTQEVRRPVAHGQALPTLTATTTSTSNEVDGVNSPSVTRGKNGTRIPANFKPTPTMIRWAQDNAPNVDWATSTRKFSAHYRSAAGTNQFKTDWTAAWESWLIGDQQKTRAPQFKTAAERKLEEGARLHAKYSAMEAESAQLQIEGTPA